MGAPVKDLSCPHCGKSIDEVVQHAVYGGRPPPPSGKPDKPYRGRDIEGELIIDEYHLIEDHEDDR